MLFILLRFLCCYLPKDLLLYLLDFEAKPFKDGVKYVSLLIACFFVDCGHLYYMGQLYM